MRIEYLQYFLEVCRTKSMSTAARNLHVAQQTVSMAVKALEDEWNLTLLERTNRGVSVTAAGEYGAEEARQILVHYQYICQYSQANQPSAQASALRGSLTVACAPLLTLSVMPAVLEEFSKRYPQIKVYLDEKQPGDCYTQLQTGKCDLAIYNFSPGYTLPPPSNASYAEKLLGTDCLTALVNIHSPLAHKKYLTSKSLFPAPLIFYTSDTWEQTWILDTLFGENLPEDILYTTSLLHLFDTVRKGSRIGFISRKVAPHTYLFDKNTMLNIPLRPRIDILYHMGIQQNLLASEHVQTFIDLFKKHFDF